VEQLSEAEVELRKGDRAACILSFAANMRSSMRCWVLRVPFSCQHFPALPTEKASVPSFGPSSVSLRFASFLEILCSGSLFVCKRDTRNNHRTQ
jgi:hypothetical protein